MRKFRTLVIDGEEVDIYPLKTPALRPLLVDKDGREVLKTSVKKSTRAEYKYEVNGQEIHEKDVCFKIGSKILSGKPKFCQVIKSFMEIPEKDISECIIEHEYFCHSPNLLKRLQKNRKMLSFPFSFGLGWALYQGILKVYGKSHLIFYCALPGVTKGTLLVRMNEALNETTKEISEDNLAIAELINEQAKMFAGN